MVNQTRLFGRGTLLNFATKILASFDEPSLFLSITKVSADAHQQIFSLPVSPLADVHRHLKVAFENQYRGSQTLEEIRTFFINSIAVHGYRYIGLTSQKNLVMQFAQPGRTIGYEITPVQMPLVPMPRTWKFKIAPFVILGDSMSP